MAKRSNQKLKILYLYKILLDNTNEQNGMTLAQILRELESYGVRAERKSVYDDIAALRIFGVDVRTSRDRYIKYYVAERKFELAELKLIFDLLMSNGFVGDTKRRELLKKFNMPLSEELFEETEFSSRATRNGNENGYENLSRICNAIISDRKIRFKCFEWNTRKQRVVQFDGEYFILNPIKLVFNDGGYEAVCFNETTNSCETYRIDRMLDLSLVNVKRAKPASEFVDSRTERVRLRCDNLIASDVFERFGFDVTVLYEREDHFEASVKTDISNEFFSWVFTKNGKVRINEPQWVKEKYIDMIKKSLCEDEKE